MRVIGALIVIWLALGLAGAAAVYARGPVSISDVVLGPITLVHEWRRG